MIWNTRAEMGFLTRIIIICLVAAIILTVSSGRLDAAFSSATGPLKQMLGLDDKEQQMKAEQQRVKEELVAVAKTTLTSLSGSVDLCEKTADKFCECTSKDLTEIGQNSLFFSPAQGKIKLLDQNLAPISESSPLYTITGNFNTIGYEFKNPNTVPPQDKSDFYVTNRPQSLKSDGVSPKILEPGNIRLIKIDAKTYVLAQ